MASNQQVTVTITDSAGSMTKQAQLPSNAQVSRLLGALITKLNLPQSTQYAIVHKQSGKQLQPNDTLTGAGVKDGDTLRLVNDMVAG